MKINSGNGISKFITNMTKADALAPVIALEATVTGGRTLQAYKRGGLDEARERAIEETTGAIVWLGGVKVLNSFGDKILAKYLGPQGGSFDVGTDKVLRKPFDNFMKKAAPKNFSAKQIALLKGAKVLSSVLLADAFIGLIVPPINQALTRKIQAKKQASKQEAITTQKQKENSIKAGSNPSFKGGFGAINTFTNAIENTNIGKLLSTDVGLVSGRMYSARNNDERREIAIRDIGSIYFYLLAQNHVASILNYLQTGKLARLNPTTTETLDKQLQDFLAKNGGEMSVEDFKKAVLGLKSSEIKLPDGIEFESAELSGFTKFMDKILSKKTEPLQVAKLSDLKKHFTDPVILERLEEMAKLQPKRLEEAVITKQQIIDAINLAEINDPKFLDKVYGEFTNNAHKNEFRFVSNNKLTNLKTEMEDYINLFCKNAKDGKINNAVLENAKKKNLIYSGINFAAGFAFAALFLSTLIPKFQYYVTKKTTGIETFPGTYDYNKN